jgi:hypothetical protein
VVHEEDRKAGAFAHEGAVPQDVGDSCERAPRGTTTTLFSV